MSNGDGLDFSKLVLIAGGHSAFQLLWAGIELNLYDTLSSKPRMTLPELSTHLKLTEYSARVLLTGLSALGILKKHGDSYSNATLAENMLVPGRPQYIGPILAWQARIVYPALVDFVDSLRQSTNVGLRHFPGKGSTLYERLQASPELECVFQNAMSTLSAQANRHFVEAYDFGRFSRIVDAGGGDGTNAIALAHRYPNLEITIFDNKSVCAIADEKIASAHLSHRVFTQIGDFLNDPFPSNVDAIVFCHIFTIQSMERNLTLLRKCRQSLSKNGAVLLFNMMADDDGAGPLSVALGSLYFLSIATGEGMLHAWRDYEQALLSAEFTRVERVANLPLDHGMLIGHK